MTLVILSCALPQYQQWWPFFVVLFYLLSPIPTVIAKRYAAQNQSSSCVELCIFFTMGLIVSCFALPIVLARAHTIAWGACYLTLCGNVVVYLTLLGYFLTFDSDDSDYGLW